LRFLIAMGALITLSSMVCFPIKALVTSWT